MNLTDSINRVSEECHKDSSEQNHDQNQKGQIQNQEHYTNRTNESKSSTDVKSKTPPQITTFTTAEAVATDTHTATKPVVSPVVSLPPTRRATVGPGSVASSTLTTHTVS